MKTLLVIDNRDSYTYNLVQVLRAETADSPDIEVAVVSADASAHERDAVLAGIATGQVCGVVISPGPGHPAKAGDFELSGAVIDAVLQTGSVPSSAGGEINGFAHGCRSNSTSNGLPEIALGRAPIPLFGVCLGHQGLAMRFGCTVQVAPQPRHGWLSPLEHSVTGVFAGLPQGTKVTRYHSLAISEPSASSGLRVIARSEDGVIQGIEVPGAPWFGVQFHPESIASTHGEPLLANFVDVVKQHLATESNSDSPPFQTKTPKALVARGAVDACSTPMAASEHFLATQQVCDKDSGGLEVQDSIVLRTLFDAGVFTRGAGSFWLESGRVDEDSRYSILGDGVDANDDGSAYVLSYTPGQVHRSVYRETPSSDSYSNAAATRTSTTGAAVGSAWAVASAQQVEHLSTETCDDPFAYIEQEMRRSVTALDSGASSLPFAGGLVGYFSYEAGLENMGLTPVAQAEEPSAVWVRPARFLIADRHTGALTACAVAAAPEVASTLAAELSKQVARALSSAGDGESPVLAAAQGKLAYPASQGGVALAPGVWRDDPAEYQEKITRCQAELKAGESYELCLTNEFTVESSIDPDPLELFTDLLRNHPAQYMAYCEAAGTVLVSASPERFLRTDGVVRDSRWGPVRMYDTKPIKGTAARNADPQLDRLAVESLAADAKTFAENLMIADLLRNDLGRLAVPDGVSVPKFMDVETFASLHQLVSTVQADIPADVSPVEVAAVLMPGGSMTGAPKLRSVEILGALEGRARGAYSGALGFFSAHGAAQLSIVIRTAVKTGADPWRIGAGGAIVLDSDPVAETAEVELKARALREAFARVSALSQ